MIPTPEVVLAAICALIAACLLSAGISFHYTGKYYRAQASALEAKRNADATRANAAERIKETVAASREAARGLEIDALQAKLDAHAAAIVADAARGVHSARDLQRMLDADATNRAIGRETTPPARIVLVAKDSGNDLADCRETSTTTSIASAIFDGELSFCRAGLQAWSDRENELRKELK